LIDTGMPYSRNGELTFPPPILGFLLEPKRGTQPALVLVGTERKRLKEYLKAVPVLEPSDELTAKATPCWSDAEFEINAGLATAIQCKARGWDTLAEALLTGSRKMFCGGPAASPFLQPANEPPKRALARVALAHWANELVRADSDRAQIAERLEALLESEPVLDTQPNRLLLRSLRATLAPSTAAPGSIEAMIDRLMELTSSRVYGGEFAPDYLRLKLLGFQAVPELIQHLDDERLTRAVRRGFNNFPTIHARIGMLASDLLEELAAPGLGRNWLDRQYGGPVRKRIAQAWWNKAEKIGEEAYAIRHVLPPIGTEKVRTAWPHGTLLRILAVRYWWRLPSVYRTILHQRPQLQSWPVAEAVANSGLTTAQKLILLREAMKNKNPAHAKPALRQLRRLDRQEAVYHLGREGEVDTGGTGERVPELETPDRLQGIKSWLTK
jgi:hypothetical protein